MKRIVVCCIVALLLTGCGTGGMPAEYADVLQNSTGVDTPAGTVAPTLTPEESDFRNLRWGMTLTEVTSTEGGGYELVDGQNIRYTRLREEGFPAEAEFTFTEEALDSAIFYIACEDGSQSLQDYEQLKQRFVARFGAPATEDMMWAEQQEEVPQEQYAQVIQEGGLRIRTKWSTERTNISMVLARRKQEPCIGIRYTPAEQ